MGPRPLLLDSPPITSLDEYVASGGGRGLEIATGLTPEGVLDEIEISGLRGRGGAGFPTHLKWRSIASGGDAVGERFVVANGAEGEPGTFKDRYLLRHDPYLVVEGLAIAARTVGARRGFVALKASFEAEVRAVTAALEEVSVAGWLDGLEMTVVGGPDAYLFGEEKALLEVIEGDDPLPRQFPPYVYGLFTTSPQMGWSAGRELGGPSGSNPTLVNNVETLANVPLILREGGEWYRGIGTAESPGTIICTVSGDTTRHGVGEFEMGTPVAEIVATLGDGLPDGRAVKYVLSGISNPVLRGDDLPTPASYEGMEAAGSGLGTAGFVVYDDRTDPAELAYAVSRFLSVESCGQCPACKLGCTAVTDLLSGMASVSEGRVFGELVARLGTVTDAARCFLPSQEQRVVTSLVPDMRVEAMRAPTRGLVTVSTIVDIRDGRCILDERQAHKRSDWTYADER